MVVTGSFYGSCRPHVDIDLDALITRKCALDRINEAFAAMNAGEVAREVIRF